MCSLLRERFSKLPRSRSSLVFPNETETNQMVGSCHSERLNVSLYKVVILVSNVAEGQLVVKEREREKEMLRVSKKEQEALQIRGLAGDRMIKREK